MTDLQSRRPVHTPLGVITGRDAIFLEAMHFDIDNGGLHLEGGINGALASDPPNKQSGYYLRQNYHFILHFFGVLAFQMIELDSANHLSDLTLDEADDSNGSSFDEVRNSRWIARLGGKVTPQHKHYSFGTYDDVFEVVCREYSLSVFQKIDDPATEQVSPNRT